MGLFDKKPQSEVKKTSAPKKKVWEPSPELRDSFEKYWVAKFLSDKQIKTVCLRFAFIKPMVQDAYFTGASVTVEGENTCAVCHQNTTLTDEKQGEILDGLRKQGL